MKKMILEEIEEKKTKISSFIKFSLRRIKHRGLVAIMRFREKLKSKYNFEET